jgi:hypothetical protein
MNVDEQYEIEPNVTIDKYQSKRDRNIVIKNISIDVTH